MNKKIASYVTLFWLAIVYREILVLPEEFIPQFDEVTTTELLAS